MVFTTRVNLSNGNRIVDVSNVDGDRLAVMEVNGTLVAFEPIVKLGRVDMARIARKVPPLAIPSFWE
jgi:hypothetical protein